MQSQPENNPRPSIAESAQALYASFDLSPKSESELLSAAYRRFFADRSIGPNPAPDDPRAIKIGELSNFANRHLNHARSLKVNSHIEFAGRFISEGRLALLKDEPISTHGLLEIRLRDGGNALLADNRIVPIAGGVAMTHISVSAVRPGELKFHLRPMLSPRAYGAEVDNFIRLIDEKATPQDLEKHSFMYCAFRSALAANYGVAAPWYKELRTMRFIGPRESPQFIFGVSPIQEFIVTPQFIPDSCGLGASTRLLGQP